MQSLLSRQWHHLNSEEVTRILETHPVQGLDVFQIKRRFEHFGPNRVLSKPGKSALKRFLLQFHQPLIYILLASGVITAFIKGPVDASVIIVVVVLNAIIGFFQEAKAVNAIEALSKTVITQATLMRSGERTVLPSTEIVPGDIVLLQSGDKVPADIRLLEVKNLQVDESALTGESLPVSKTQEILDIETILPSRRNMAYASSLVTYGQAKGVVVGTGMSTEIGRISKLISEADMILTPLTKKIAHFSHILLYVILGMAALTVVIGILQGHQGVELFIAAVALSVAAIPEGLPAVVTITLAIGVHQMAKRGAIIRKLPAVETLGGVTVICSDKTGTLTENQMTVREIKTLERDYAITGSGYAKLGEIFWDNRKIQLKDDKAIHECLLAGVLCNDSKIADNSNQWTVQGDPTEAALLIAADKAGVLLTAGKLWKRLDSIPFESQHQYMAVLMSFIENGKKTIFIKGAPEAVLRRCSNQMGVSGAVYPLDPARLQKQIEELATKGLRVLAFGKLDVMLEQTHLDSHHVEKDLILLGLQAMIDPPRPEAVNAVQECKEAGIQVKMITGDHRVTAQAIASQIKIGLKGRDAPDVLTGKELEVLSDREFVCAAQNTSVFARVTPEQKLRLVEALQMSGHVVAMTGDGVNDAPALKQADIGVAMGITGTDVAKDAADMILTDDNFATIKSAVREGRQIFDNLTKFILWILPTNVGQGLVILTAILADEPLPILPVQILWINMVSAVLLGLTLAFEPPESNVMARPPRNPKAPILTKGLVARLFMVGVMLLGGAFHVFESQLRSGQSEDSARTAAVGVFMIGQSFYLLNCRSLTNSIFSIGLFSNPWLLVGISATMVCHLLFIYTPWMNAWFHTAPISSSAWIQTISIGFLIYTVIGIEKWVVKRFLHRKD